VPLNPEPEPSRLMAWLLAINLQWYWFRNNNNIWALGTCFLAGVLLGLWVS
jgi:hypothetical protein